MRKDDLPDESKMCVLPDQTIEGLKICGKFTFNELTDFIFTLVPFLAHSFNELIKVLLSNGMEFVLTERFNQDPVEYFLVNRDLEEAAVTIHLSHNSCTTPRPRNHLLLVVVVIYHRKGAIPSTYPLCPGQ